MKYPKTRRKQNGLPQEANFNIGKVQSRLQYQSFPISKRQYLCYSNIEQDNSRRTYKSKIIHKPRNYISTCRPKRAQTMQRGLIDLACWNQRYHTGRKLKHPKDGGKVRKLRDPWQRKTQPPWLNSPSDRIRLASTVQNRREEEEGEGRAAEYWDWSLRRNFPFDSTSYVIIIIIIVSVIIYLIKLRNKLKKIMKNDHTNYFQIQAKKVVFVHFQI